MEQNYQMRVASLSTSSTLSAVGVLTLSGPNVILAALTRSPWVFFFVSLIGFGLWLAGMYNTSTAFKGANDNVAAHYKKLFNTYLSLLIVAAIVWVISRIIISSSTDPEHIFDLDRHKASYVIMQLLVVAFYVYAIVCISIGISESRALKAAGLRSMGHVFVAFILILIVVVIMTIVSFVFISNADKMAVSFIRSNADSILGGLTVIYVLCVLAALVAVVFMNIGWWSVRSELPKVLGETSDKAEL